VAIRYPDRRALADALKRLVDGGVALDGAADHGVSEALYVHDPDGNGLELYWDRPREAWPRRPDGSIQMFTHPLDTNALLAEATRTAALSLTDATRGRLKRLRQQLLTLHKALLDDSKAAYEMDRGRVASPGQLLQLVINDPWFAWLHQISELIVRIDEAAATNGAATEADAAALVDQVDRLLVPSETGDAFARRYFEALQRQPSVVLAHGDVRRTLKSAD
jgi:hypothetical protein